MTENSPLRADRPWSWLLRIIGVEDPEALARALDARGIAGEDLRRK